MDRETAVKVNNDGDREISLVLEPWGEIYRIAPESFLDVIVLGVSGSPIEISSSVNGLTFWPPGGSTVRILSADGTALGEQGGPRSRTP